MMHYGGLAPVALTAGILMTATLASAQSPPAGISDAHGWKTVACPIHAWLPLFGADVTLSGQPTPPGSGGGSGGITIPSATTRAEAARPSIEWKPISHLSLGAGWGWPYLRVDGIVQAKDVHLSQTLNGPLLTLGIPF